MPGCNCLFLQSVSGLRKSPTPESLARADFDWAKPPPRLRGLNPVYTSPPGGPRHHSRRPLRLYKAGGGCGERGFHIHVMLALLPPSAGGRSLGKGRCVWFHVWGEEAAALYQKGGKSHPLRVFSFSPPPHFSSPLSTNTQPSCCKKKPLWRRLFKGGNGEALVSPSLETLKQ